MINVPKLTKFARRELTSIEDPKNWKWTHYMHSKVEHSQWFIDCDQGPEMNRICQTSCHPWWQWPCFRFLAHCTYIQTMDIHLILVGIYNLRFTTGILRVGFPCTIPMLSIHPYQPLIHVVSNETHGTQGTHDFFSLKYLRYIITWL